MGGLVVGMIGLMMGDIRGKESMGVRGEPVPLNEGRKVHHLGFPWPLGVELLPTQDMCRLCLRKFQYLQFLISK